MTRCAATDAAMIPPGRAGAFVHSVYHFASVAHVGERESVRYPGATIVLSRRQLWAASAAGAAMTAADASRFDVAASALHSLSRLRGEVNLIAVSHFPCRQLR